MCLGIMTPAQDSDVQTTGGALALSIYEQLGRDEFNLFYIHNPDRLLFANLLRKRKKLATKVARFRSTSKGRRDRRKRRYETCP